MDNAVVWIIIIAAAAVLVGLRFAISYFVNLAARKGSDAIENAVARKKNENASQNGPERLADKYKK